MPIHIAQRLRETAAYPFALIKQQVDDLRAVGIDPVDFGVGDPTWPTPALMRERLKTAVDERATSGYPSYIGNADFRAACAGWMERALGVKLDPGTEVTSTIGSKEGIFHFPLAFVDPGDVVLCPSPGYPPYSRGTTFAGGTPYFYPLTRENHYLPDLSSIPDDVAHKARILWLCYPNAPTGAVAPPAFLEEAIAWARARDILIVNDEAYADLYYGERPRSILEFGKDGVAAVFSLSKRSAMTGWRIGWTAGDAEVIAAFRKVKTNIDSGTPAFIQDAAIAALADEQHVEEMREDYRQKRALLAAVFVDLGFPDCAPDATIHYWQRLPEHIDAVEFAQRLLHKNIATVCTPGPWLGDDCRGQNPGDGHVRFSLVPSVADTERACHAMRAHRDMLLA